MPKAASTPLAHLVNAYQNDLRVRNYKPKTINGYAKNLTTFVNWAEAQGKTTLADLDAELVKRYIRYLQEKPKYAERHYATTSTEHVSAAAIRNYVRDVKTFARWLAEEQYTAAHVLANVKTPKADETPIQPFTDEDLDRIFGALDTSDQIDLRDYVLLHTLWDTGMREGELVNLTLDDVVATRPAFHLATLTFLPLLLSAIRGGIRVVGVTEALPGWRKQISEQSWIYILVNVFVPFLYLANFVRSLLTRKMRWRGVQYELLGQGQTRIIA